MALSERSELFLNVIGCQASLQLWTLCPSEHPSKSSKHAHESEMLVPSTTAGVGKILQFRPQKPRSTINLREEYRTKVLMTLDPLSTK